MGLTLKDIKRRNGTLYGAGAPSGGAMQFGTGCVQSELDGTEHILNVDEKAVIPDEFSWQMAMPPVRNQGMSSTCVCQSLTGVLDFLHNSKKGVSGVCNNYSVNELYSVRKNKFANGMTFKEAMHYLRHNGLKGADGETEKIGSYAMVKSELAAKYAIMMFGPIVAGLPVYSADQTHFWRKGGKYQGGHAVTFVGYDRAGFWIRNSWGERWALNGHVLLPYSECNNIFEMWTVAI